MSTTEIKCVDCGTLREAPNASLHLIKRCKPCQKKHSKQRALERYYAKTGRKPKPKKKKAKKAESKSKKGWMLGPEDRSSKSADSGSSLDGMTDQEKYDLFKKIGDKTFGDGWFDSQYNEDDW